MLALGPYLHLNGQILTIGDWPVPLPYLALYYLIPFLNLTRSLSRYDLMVMLTLGVLAAVALAQIQAIFHRRQQQFAMWPSLIAGALICAEFVAAPYPVSMIDIPRFYTDLAADPGDFTNAELPLNWDRPTPLLHQTVHGKRLLTAYTSRQNPLELTRSTPVFQQWRYPARTSSTNRWPRLPPPFFTISTCATWCWITGRCPRPGAGANERWCGRRPAAGKRPGAGRWAAEGVRHPAPPDGAALPEPGRWLGAAP